MHCDGSRNDQKIVYYDFAHAPSKVKATVDSIIQAYPSQRVLCILELHTFSSLNPDFLPLYAGCLDGVGRSVVLLDDETIQAKKMEYLDDETIQNSFENESIEIVRCKFDLQKILENEKAHYQVILIMSSGKLGGLNIRTFPF